MQQISIFDYLTSEDLPKVGDTIIDDELQSGIVTSVSEDYIEAKFKDKTTLTPKRAFKYFFKVVNERGL
jgi:hypothetical protein